MPRPVGFIAGLPIERFWRNVKIESSGCWIWTDGKDRRGYGVFYAEGRNQRAHKWLYERVFGPVSVGRELGHVLPTRGLRHNPACVCPVHVRPITYGQNLLEAPSGIAAINAAKQRCPRGHSYSPENTYVDPDGNRECRKCQRKRGERRRKNQVRTPEYLAKQRQYRIERAETYNAARKAKYRAEHPKPEKQKVCHAGHSLEDPRNVYLAGGKRHCRECRRLAQQRYVKRKNSRY